MGNLDRECLGFAWETITRIKEKEPNLGGDVLKNSKRAGSMVQSDGISATLAFIYSRGKNSWNRVGDGVLEWLNKRGLISTQPKDRMSIFEEISKMEEWKISLIEKEAMRFLSWLGRLCEGEFREEG